MLRSTAIFRQVYFTEQSPALVQAAAALGLKSNVWVEEWMLNQPANNLKPGKKAPNPSKVTLWKSLELYNADQLSKRDQSPAAPEVNASAHSAVVSQRPYGKAMAFDMEAISVKNSYASKWWIPAGKTWGRSSEYLPRDSKEQPHKFFITGAVSLYPLETLEGSTTLLKTPISGGTRRFFKEDGDRAEALRAFAKSNGFSSYLFFTDKQLNRAGIEIKPDAVPIAISSGESTNNYSVYNIEQLAGYENILASIGRYGNPDAPVYLFSGMEVKSKSVQDAQKKFTQRYWVSHRDIEQNLWSLASESERPISSSSVEFANNFINVEQLVNPTEGFARAGLLEMVVKQ
eukprot:GILI01009101.1.p1 GENE.GILI01009101.1~~GILI01009101.1.p1  ORF type:complete len:345 (-),score=115.60 GILI01009101.1:212-1246(-)